MLLKSKSFSPLSVDLSARSLTTILWRIALILLFTNIVFVVLSTVFHHHYSIAKYFFFDLRLNVPFFFSLGQLWLIVFLIFHIVKTPSVSLNQLPFWKTLGIIFFLFTLDATFDLHYKFKMSTFGTIASYDEKSPSHYLWVIPYFLIFGFLIIRVFYQGKAIPLDIKHNIIFASLVFLSGAVIMEFIGIFYFVMTREVDLWLLLIKTTETFLQMVGAIIFINTFLAYRSGLAKKAS